MPRLPSASLLARAARTTPAVLGTFVDAASAKGLTGAAARTLRRARLMVSRQRGARLTVARAEDAESARAASGAPRDATLIIDERIITGFVLEEGSRRVDGSARTALLGAYRRSIG